MLDLDALHRCAEQPFPCGASRLHNVEDRTPGGVVALEDQQVFSLGEQIRGAGRERLGGRKRRLAIHLLRRQPEFHRQLDDRQDRVLADGHGLLVDHVRWDRCRVRHWPAERHQLRSDARPLDLVVDGLIDA
jgi:hypothetical protein